MCNLHIMLRLCYDAAMMRRGLIPLFVLLVLVAGLAAEPALAAFELEPGTHQGADYLLISDGPRFELRIDNGASRLVLGTNEFTPQQLLQFVAALPEFLEGASRLSEGQSLALRQAGVSGYVALSATYGEPMNRFTLTFHAEAPSEVANVSAVQGLGLELMNMLLTQE